MSIEGELPALDSAETTGKEIVVWRGTRRPLLACDDPQLGNAWNIGPEWVLRAGDVLGCWPRNETLAPCVLNSPRIIELPDDYDESKDEELIQQQLRANAMDVDD